MGDTAELVDKIAQQEQNIKAMDQYIEDTRQYLGPKEELLVELASTQQSLTALLAEKHSCLAKLGKNLYICFCLLIFIEASFFMSSYLFLTCL